MELSAFSALVLACAPQVDFSTAHALVSVESAFNPWSIGVVGGTLARQPRTRAEALRTAHALRAAGWNFSVGLSQINISNFKSLGLALDAALEPCTNLSAMQTLLSDCYVRAEPPAGASQSDQVQLRKALSCYYSGNFITGFKHGYVHKVVTAASNATQSVKPVQTKEMP